MRLYKYVIGFVIILIHPLSIYSQVSLNSAPIIDIEKAMNKMDIINLSQYASSIRYVPLETKSDLVLSHITECIFSENHILISNLKACLLFDTNGNFITKIGTQGRGPGEYQYVVYTDIDNHSNIYIQSLRDLLEYRLDGTFVKKYKDLFLFSNSMNEYFTQWKVIDDSLIFGHIPNNTGLNKNKALLISKSGKIKRQFKNYDIFSVPNRSVRNSNDANAHIYLYKKSLYYKGSNNDTLFYLDNKFNLISNYIFKLGKYKEPVSERTIQIGQESTIKYLSVSDVFQTENKLLFNCRFGEYFPAKRLTPKIITLPSGKVINVWINTSNVLGIYDKNTRKLSFCKPTSTDNPLFTSGIYNDIDAGPRFFPSIQINDSTMVMWVDAKQLKDHVLSNDFKNNITKYPEKKKELENLANRISEFDNPILMVVTLK